MEGPVEIKPRFVDPAVASANAAAASAASIDVANNVIGTATGNTVNATTVDSSGSMMATIYENKLIVIIVIAVILFISFIAYVWMRKEVTPQTTPAQTVPGAGGINGVGGTDTVTPQTTTTAASTQVPNQAPNQTPTSQPAAARPTPTKEQLEAMLNRTKAVAAQAQSQAQSQLQPKTIPGSRTEADLMNIMGYNRNTVPLVPISISIATIVDEERVTDVTTDAAEIESVDEDGEEHNEDSVLMQTQSQSQTQAHDLNPWLQDDFGITSNSNVMPTSTTPTLSPELCSFILPSSRQCKNKPKSNGRCVKHSF